MTHESTYCGPLPTFISFTGKPLQAAVPPLLRGVRAVSASLDVTGSEVIKIAAVTAGSELYEISRESASAILLQVGKSCAS